jgi:hypothetical protein
MRRGVAVVVAAAAIGAVVAVLVVGSSSHARLAGSNGVDAGSFSVMLADRQDFCQTMFVPGDADRIRMTIGSYDRPTPAIDVTVRRADGSVVASHRTAGGFTQGVATLALGTTTSGPLEGGRVCVRPAGSKIALGGFQNNARVEFMRPGHESYFALAGTMLHRFGLGKPDWQGTWPAIVAFALVVAAWVLTARVLLREGSDG